MTSAPQRPARGARRRTPPNQAPRLAPHDAWQHDASLRWWTDWALQQRGIRALPGHASSGLEQIGRAVGSWTLQDAADAANRRPPELATHDRSGRRIDEVHFDDSWHRLLDTVTDSGVCGLPWTESRGGYLLRAAALEMWSRLDIGVLCPVSMTTAAVPVLQRHAPDSPWIGRLLRETNPPGRAHALAGMSMTEPQGGSDLAGSSTLATPIDGHTAHLDGHKWFCSHPVADVLLVLARDMEADEQALSCFLVEGWTDGERNGIELLRLKDKLGTRSLASAEIQLRGAVGSRLGAPGTGVRAIMEMVAHTRMDCCISSTGVMTRAIQEAIANARGRRAFGQPLIDQPLMRMVLADLVLEREAALALALEVARGFDGAQPLTRLVTAAAKYWITRRAVQVTVECVEALGGNGYTESFVPARLYRDAQVNSTWEGSGNVIALDVLRAIGREPALVDALVARVDDLVARGEEETAADVAARARAVARQAKVAAPAAARTVAGELALILQAALLTARAAQTGSTDDACAARAFAATRLRRGGERVFGCGDAALEQAAEVLPERLAVSS